MRPRRKCAVTSVLPSGKTSAQGQFICPGAILMIGFPQKRQLLWDSDLPWSMWAMIEKFLIWSCFFIFILKKEPPVGGCFLYGGGVCAPAGGGNASPFGGIAPILGVGVSLSGKRGCAPISFSPRTEKKKRGVHFNKRMVFQEEGTPVLKWTLAQHTAPAKCRPRPAGRYFFPSSVFTRSVAAWNTCSAL